MEDPKKNDRLAVLIDADNAQPAIAEGLLAEMAKYETASVKRIYGDWTLPNLGAGRRCCYSTPSSRFNSFATPRARTPRTAR
jgi:hypothetical protein